MVPHGREAVAFPCRLQDRVSRQGIISTRGLMMNFQNQAIAVSNEQVEQGSEVEICESAPMDRRHADSGYDDVKLASNNVDALMRRMSLSSTREIDSLIGELKALRAKVASDGSRVEYAVREYTDLNQSVIQLTKIISDGLTHLKKAPALPKAGVLRTQDAEDAS